ncbi:MAG: TonB-dependent receptor [Bacteroidales bacterium]|nr:TonB-dependent receptor [Bacteroidales bacterium]
MEEDLFYIEEITVTSSRTPRTIKEAPVLTQLITRKEIDRTASYTLKEVIDREIPSIEFTRHGFGDNINMQGLDAKYLLILIDGERMAGENAGNVDFSRLNASNIEKIEIVRGASSVLYGSNAMGGVINIITRKPIKQWDILSSIRYSQSNQQNFSKSFINKQDESYLKTYYRNLDKPNLNADINLGYRGLKVYSQTFLSYKSFDGYRLYDRKGLKKYYKENDSLVEAPINTTPTQVTGFEDYAFTQKVGYDFSSKLNIELMGNFYQHEEFDFTKDNKHDKYRNHTFNIKWKKLFDNKSELNMVYHVDTYYKFKFLEILDEDRLSYRHTIHNPKASYSLTIGKRHSILAGFEHYREIMYADVFVSDSLTTRTTQDAVFIVQDEWRIDSVISITAGYRGGYHSTFHYHSSPSITFRYLINDYTFRLSYAKGYRSPSLKELYMSWSHLGMFTIYGNAHLLPETNDYLSFSLDHYFKKKSLNQAFMFSYNSIYNKIDGIWTNNQQEYHYINFSNYKVLAFEYLLRYKITNLLTKLSYSYHHVLQDKKAVRRSTLSPHNLTLQFDYGFSIGKYEFGINTAAKYLGKKVYDVLDDVKNVYYEVSFPSYYLIDLTSQLKFNKKITFSFGVKNILNYTAPIVNFNTTNSPGRRFFTAITFQL